MEPVSDEDVVHKICLDDIDPDFFDELHKFLGENCQFGISIKELVGPGKHFYYFIYKGEEEKPYDHNLIAMFVHVTIHDSYATFHDVYAHKNAQRKGYMSKVYGCVLNDLSRYYDIDFVWLWVDFDNKNFEDVVSKYSRFFFTDRVYITTLNPELESIGNPVLAMVLHFKERPALREIDYAKDRESSVLIKSAKDTAVQLRKNFLESRGEYSKIVHITPEAVHVLYNMISEEEEIGYNLNPVENEGDIMLMVGNDPIKIGTRDENRCQIYFTDGKFFGHSHPLSCYKEFGNLIDPPSNLDIHTVTKLLYEQNREISFVATPEGIYTIKLTGEACRVLKLYTFSERQEIYRTYDHIVRQFYVQYPNIFMHKNQEEFDKYHLDPEEYLRNHSVEILNKINTYLRYVNNITLRKASNEYSKLDNEQKLKIKLEEEKYSKHIRDFYEEYDTEGLSMTQKRYYKHFRDIKERRAKYYNERRKAAEEKLTKRVIDRRNDEIRKIARELESKNPKGLYSFEHYHIEALKLYKKKVRKLNLNKRKEDIVKKYRFPNEEVEQKIIEHAINKSMEDVPDEDEMIDVIPLHVNDLPVQEKEQAISELLNEEFLELKRQKLQKVKEQENITRQRETLDTRLIYVEFFTWNQAKEGNIKLRTTIRDC